MLPLPAYTHPHSAPLNLATMIPGWANPSDLGPKTYIANGQVRVIVAGPYCDVTVEMRDGSIF